MKFEDRLFQEAQHNWDLERLYVKLSEVKQMSTSRTVKFTQTEKAILRGLLCGCSPKQIAVHLHWTLNSLRVELTRGIYRYVEALTDRDLNTITNWRDIVRWLDETEYKISRQNRVGQKSQKFSDYMEEKKN